jgi:hypothetical protein
MIERMAEIGRDHGLDTLIAPVRPSLKHRYPLTPIERYLSWRRPDGTHLDPWLRTHERLGADIVKVASESVVGTGTVAEWEEWTEMALPESGAYVVPARWCRLRSTASGTKAFTSSRTCGWCTRPRSLRNPRPLAWASVRECHPRLCRTNHPPGRRLAS